MFYDVQKPAKTKKVLYVFISAILYVMQKICAHNLLVLLQYDSSKNGRISLYFAGSPGAKIKRARDINLYSFFYCRISICSQKSYRKFLTEFISFVKISYSGYTIERVDLQGYTKKYSGLKRYRCDIQLYKIGIRVQ